MNKKRKKQKLIRQNPKKKIETKKRPKKKDLFFLTIFCLGILLLAYPFFADYQLSRLQYSDIKKYTKQVDLPVDIKKNIEEWNLQIDNPKLIDNNTGFNDSATVLPKPFAVIEIPKINLEVPVYFSTSDLVLSNGVGILEGTNLPMGGKGTHSVLSAHRGLSLGGMFTDLPKVKVEDLFYITFYGEKLAYEVDQIQTIEPEDLTPFGINPTKDYVTLLTCTPIGINTQRFIVRGRRVPYDEEVKKAIKPYFWTMQHVLLTVAGIVAVGVIVIIIRKESRKRS